MLPLFLHYFLLFSLLFLDSQCSSCPSHFRVQPLLCYLTLLIHRVKLGDNFNLLFYPACLLPFSFSFQRKLLCHKCYVYPFVYDWSLIFYLMLRVVPCFADCSL
jgi:hypothetical protein